MFFLVDQKTCAVGYYSLHNYFNCKLDRNLSYILGCDYEYFREGCKISSLDYLVCY
jgi:hypothetical protein